MLRALLLAHLTVTLLMTGVVLFVAIVHYPLFAKVGVAEFPAFELEHQRRTSIIVVPLMLIELACAGLLLVHPDVPRPAAIVGLVLLAGIWATTFLANVPLHEALLRQFSQELVDKQVFWNWVRTLMWCVRSALAVWLVARA